MHENLPKKLDDSKEYIDTELESVKSPEKRKYLEKMYLDIAEIVASIDAEAKETHTEDSVVYKKRRNALDEAQVIIHGIVAPHKKVESLASNKIMVSYSRRNEEWARILHLALRKMGMDVWFDNQETNVTSDEAEDGYEERGGGLDFGNELDTSIHEQRGIGIGNEWKESINNGISENGHAVVLLTHDVLDKFDVIGGQEIPKMIEKNTSIVVACVDNPQRGSVFERLKKFTQENETHKKYRNSIEVLSKAPRVALSEGDFTAPKSNLGEKIVESIPVTDADAVMTPQDNGTPAQSSNILESIDILKEHVSEDDSYKGQVQKRALEECQIIIKSQTDPKKLVARKHLRSQFFHYPKRQLRTPDIYDQVSATFEDMGLWKEDTQQEGGYTLLPLTKEKMNDYTASFVSNFSEFVDSDTLWILVGEPGFFDSLNEVLEKAIQERDVLKKGQDTRKIDEMLKKIAILEKFKKTQGLFVSDNDLKNPKGLASYLLMKQALSEVKK
ncbi:MAG: toll/interleukin-1 receptor domain-containing protein [Candidatus Pacebacteria bacterium]|jgi:hypothetical protein|nr:toll/interleukin-1 receptor domain-containing protein [Candidatus Paceibacterota bacterium]